MREAWDYFLCLSILYCVVEQVNMDLVTRNDLLKRLDQLQINGIEVSCVIGDLPEERCGEQILLVDLTLFLDLSKAIQSDRLPDTIDYPGMAAAIRSSLREARCQMIEHAAGLVVQEALRDQRVEAVRVRVQKRGAVVGLHDASVQLLRFREDIG